MSISLNISLITVAASLGAEVLEKLPVKLPIGVLLADTITIFSDITQTDYKYFNLQKINVYFW